MSLSMAPLLMHSTDVSLTVRDALIAAYAAGPDERDGHLEIAARMLHREMDLPCEDVRELVGLPLGSC